MMTHAMNCASLTLISPVVVEHEWQYIWFDNCHQHFLLLNKSYFYILSFEAKVPTPNMYYHQEDLPKNIILAKLSLDLKIIAIQSTLLSVLVIDTTNKKKWLVEIKHPNDNIILPDGIIWSDHGGNSQDLIIVTTRGLELYKISQVRSQCKLSRVISQPGSFTFWYEPSHRMTLMASCQKSHTSMSSSSNYGDNNGQNNNHRPAHMSEILLMDGYFLKHERSPMPLLELPAPDKAPRFELGPGVLSDNISLHSLYGRLCCLVHYTEADTSDFITVYHVTKYSVTRAHCLSLNCITDTLKFSVYDNLLLCHSQRMHTTFTFDLLKTPKRIGPNSSESRETTDPVSEQPSRIHFVQFVAGTFEPSSAIAPKTITEGFLKGTIATVGERGNSHRSTKSNINVTAVEGRISSDLHGDSDDDDELSGSSIDEGRAGRGDSDEQSRDSNHAVGAEHVDLDAEGDESEWNAVSNSKHKLNLLATMGFKHTAGGGDAIAASHRSISMSDVSVKRYSSLQFQGAVSDYVTTHSTNCNNAVFSNVVLSSNHLNSHTTRSGGKNRVVSIKHTPATDPASTVGNRVKLLSQPLYLAEVYYSDLYEFRYPNLLYDKTKKIMYRLVVDCAALLKTEEGRSGSRETLQFLARRGQLYMQFNRPVSVANSGGNAHLAAIMQSYSNPTNPAERALNYKFISETGQIAKYLLLNELFSCVEHSRRRGLSVLEELIAVVMAPYVNEVRRQFHAQNDTENSADGGGHGSGYASNASNNGGGVGGDPVYSVSGAKDSGFGLLRRKTLSDGLFGLKQQAVRKGSVVGAGVGSNSAHVGATGGDVDNSCFFVDSEPLEPINNSSSSSTYLPDISRIGIRARSLTEKVPSLVPTAAEDAGLLSYIPVPLTTRRDVFGNLILTQSEILSYVWLPLMLNLNSEEDFDAATWALQSYVSTLREMDVPLLPANSLLLMNVMFCRGRYMEVARLLQLNFFPDAGEVAMSALELHDILEDLLVYHERKHAMHNDSSPTKLKIFSNVDLAGSVLDQQRARCAIATLQQAALDMLWRLDEKTTIVRWHLTHGLVLEAIMLCTKKLGVWRSGLPPGCISGSEFFSSALQVVSAMTLEQGSSSDLNMAHRLIRESEAMDVLVEQEEREEARSRALASGYKDDGDHNSPSVSDKSIPTLLLDPSSRTSAYPFRDLLVQEQHEALNSRRVALLYTVYQFIREWDNSVLLVSTNLIKSKLAVHTHFPEQLFDLATTRKFKELFGFI